MPGRRAEGGAPPAAEERGVEPGGVEARPREPRRPAIRRLWPVREELRVPEPK